MSVIYDFAILMIGFIIRVASVFKPKARMWIEGRKRIFAKLEQTIDKTADIAWFHAASLGEFEQGRPVIERFKQTHPNYKILVTFFSPSGYEVRKNYAGADYIFYLPLDTTRNAKRFIQIVNPKIVIFIKYEFWANFLKFAKINGAKVYVISAIFRRDSAFFKWYGVRYRNILTYFDHIFVQNQDSKDLLSKIGLKNVSVTGDTRFDRVYSIATQSKQLPEIEQFAGDSSVFIAGSTWQPDEDIIMKAVNEHRNLKFIIAPHEIDSDRIENFRAVIDRPSVRYTQISDPTDLAAADVLIIDTIGILSSVYRYGHFGYIGGGFGVGIHNILEAATFGLPLIFGPNYRKFKEACDLVELGGATSIKAYDDVDEWLRFMTDADKYETSSSICRDYVLNNRGATEMIIRQIFLS